jgi:inosine-uridine nucleoside N-ribohydrolase
MEVTDIQIGKGTNKSGSSDASHIHGSDGLGNASQFLSKVKIPKKALSSISLITATLKKYPETQVLIFGPMTNIANYIGQKDAISINRVIAMG